MVGAEIYHSVILIYFGKKQRAEIFAHDHKPGRLKIVFCEHLSRFETNLHRQPLFRGLAMVS